MNGILQEVIKETASSFWRELGKEAVRRSVAAAVSEVIRAKVDIWKHRQLEHQKRELHRQFAEEDAAAEAAIVAEEEAATTEEVEEEAEREEEEELRERDEELVEQDPLPGDPGNAPPLPDDL